VHEAIDADAHVESVVGALDGGIGAAVKFPAGEKADVVWLGDGDPGALEATGTSL